MTASTSPIRTVLPNGLVVLARETRKTPAVTISIAVRAGSAYDPPRQVGLTNLLARMIDRGTVTRSAEDIAEELDSRGIALQVASTRHLLSVLCTCLAEDFDSVFALLSDIVMQPSFPDDELVKRKGEVITAIRQDDDNPAVQAVESLMARLYPDDHPYGRKQKGSIADVEAFTASHLRAQHQSRFAPSELTLVVVGDVPAGRVADAAERRFGDWHAAPGPPLAIPPVQPATARSRVVIPMMNKAQTDIAYGFTTIRRSDPSYYAYWLMNNILGQYALGGRLGDSIRERQGMAYYVSSALDANIAEGPLAVRAGVSAANVERAIASIDEELAVMVRDGVTAKELAESRQYLIGSMPRALETNAGIAQFLQTAEFFGLGLDYEQQLPQLLGRVTLEEVNASARAALDPARATVVVAGPYQGN